MRNVRIIFCLALSCMLSGLTAQQPENLSFRISSKSKVVMADLIVTDKDNHYVTDLKPGEVQILEDGKPQAITYFLFVQAGEAAPTVPAGHETGRFTIPALAPGGRMQFAAPAPSLHVAIVLDFCNMPQEGFLQVKKAIMDYVKTQLAPHDRIMVVALSTRVELLQEFTSDRDRLETVLGKIQGKAFGAAPQASLIRLIDRIETIVGGKDPRKFNPGAREMCIEEGKAFIIALEQRLFFVSHGLNAVSRYLASLPGRKHLVFYSAGYPLNGPEMVSGLLAERLSGGVGGGDPAVSANLWGVQREQLSTYFQSVIDRANRSQVSFYTIDVRGLIASPPGGDASTSSSAYLLRRGLMQKHQDRDINAPQDFLVGIAAGTGGVCYLNTNDMQKAIKRACLDSRQYYLLAFQPSASGKPGQYHKLEVKVNRPGIAVSARKGYYDLSDTQVIQQDLLNAIKFPSLFQQFPLTIAENIGGGSLTVSTTIPTAAVEFITDGDKKTGSVEIYGALLDKEGKLVGQKWLFAKTYTLSLSDQQLAEFLNNENMVSTLKGAAQPGEYTLAVVARQAATGRISASTKKLSITP